MAKLQLNNNKKKDALDKIREHLFSNGKKKLSPTLQITLTNYKRFFTHFLAGNTYQECIAILQDELSLSEPQAYNIARNATALFGNVGDTNKELERIVLVEQLKLNARKCRENKDFEGERKALESIAKISGIWNSGDVNVDLKINLPTVVVASNDIDILKQQAEAPIDYEELI